MYDDPFELFRTLKPCWRIVLNHHILSIQIILLLHSRSFYRLVPAHPGRSGIVLFINFGGRVGVTGCARYERRALCEHLGFFYMRVLVKLFMITSLGFHF